MADLRVRTLTPEEHRTFLASRPTHSFLQSPAWGRVKQQWRSESLGWVDGTGRIVGAGLVLLRPLPVVRRCLAYLPEGPVIDWDTDLGPWLRPLAAALRERDAFTIRIGPPVVARRWSAATVKGAVGAQQTTQLSNVPADERTVAADRLPRALQGLGWRRAASSASGFAAGQPRYVFQLDLKGRTEDDVLKGMNQQWRRNIKKSASAGVEVVRGSGEEHLAAFHDVYVETARRDHFTPRPLEYFQTMFRALRAEDADRIRLYLARHESDVVAATIWVRVGTHTWYSYGASSTAKRELRGSNAVQWRMIRDAMAAHADVYDLRGITETLDENDPHYGLIRFKLGTGGDAVEYAGEWDLPLSRPLYAAFDRYLRRRG